MRKRIQNSHKMDEEINRIKEKQKFSDINCMNITKEM